MIGTLEQEIILNWRSKSPNEKRSLLQKYESKNAQEFERDERTVVFEKFKQDDVHGMFRSREPNKIFISDDPHVNVSGLNAINVAYHEGIHATIFDFIKQKHLKFCQYGSLNSKELYTLGEKDRIYYQDIIKEWHDTTGSNEEVIAYAEGTKNAIEHFLTLDIDQAKDSYSHYYNLIRNYIKQKALNKQCYNTSIINAINNINQTFCHVLQFDDSIFNSAFPKAVFCKKDNAEIVNGHLDFMAEKVKSMRQAGEIKQKMKLALEIGQRYEDDRNKIKTR